MTVELRMPALSPTMEKGTLARWLVAEGTFVKAGDVLAEIETDKATMEFEAVDEGRVARFLVEEGTDDVAVGTVIALLASEGEAVPDLAPVVAPTPPVAAAELTTSAETLAVETLASAIAAPGPIALPESASVSARPDVAAQFASRNDFDATPLARRIAAMARIDLAAITGSGPRGRITKRDLGLAGRVQTQQPLGHALANVLALETEVTPPPVGVPAHAEKLTGMRKTIARRLSESKRTVPHFYLTSRCNIDALLNLRRELNHALLDQGIKLSVNDLLIKALALALVEVPDANVQFGGEQLHRFERVDISMAVAIDGGLITPVIHDVGSLSLSAIARTSRQLADRARTGSLSPEDYQGGTASISNLGMFGVDEIVPVINPPQALILGVGAGVEQPWKVDGGIALATILAATASFDHRAIDGAVAAQFMQALRDLIETPLQIVS